MRPVLWSPPETLSPAEEAIVARVTRAKLFVFLRSWRHRLFDAAFQEELAAMYQDSPLGQPPVPPARLALATILQAYTGASDDEVIEASLMDRRWQLVLDCLDADEPPFSKGTLVAFRQRLIAAGLDRRLIERTVELAEETQGFGSRHLRAALDSSPLWGAGRVDATRTDNLLGHALRKALGLLARRSGQTLEELAAEAGAPEVAGTSLKAALDLDWQHPGARQEGLPRVLEALRAVEAWVGEHPERAAGPGVQESLVAAREVEAQDVVHDGDGQSQLRQGVARERRISIEDPQMRHGRKSRSQRVDGYKRHVLRDLDTHLVRAMGLTPANAPEASVTGDILADLEAQGATLGELHIDRGYLASDLVRERPPELAIYCKAWRVHNGPRHPKTAFALDWERGMLRCPAGVQMPFEAGGTVRFPPERCGACAQRERCTTSVRGRSVHIHPDERLMAELRERQATPEGRAKLRERVGVEHALAHVGHWQGRRARYVGQRKNLFDTRRSAVVHNLHVISRTSRAAPPS